MFTRKDILFNFNAEHKFWEMFLIGFGMRFCSHSHFGGRASRKPNVDSQLSFVADSNDQLEKAENNIA